MVPDANEPVVLTTVSTEARAALIVSALDNCGVQAQLEGALTSAFRAEAPGSVRILVRRTDLQRAQEALRAIEAGAEGERPA